MLCKRTNEENKNLIFQIVYCLYRNKLCHALVYSVTAGVDFKKLYSPCIL